MRVLTVVGARPQFIKAAPVTNALREAGYEEILVHTGQHYDHQMSQVFFDELAIARPDVELAVGSDNPGRQLARILMELEPVVARTRPDWVIVYGDTNSTLAGALAANKARVPLVHVEAGLRSFNREMPEEHNRVLTDHMADMLFCPTATAVSNLEREGIERGVHLVGDPMLDAIQHFLPLARARSSPLDRLGVSKKKYALATVHRPYTVDIPERFASIMTALSALDFPVIFPIHPRTRVRTGETLNEGAWGANIRVIEPLGYLEMLMLEENAALILTDSGGVQREACFLGVPCLTLRPETEWVETVESGWNIVVDTDSDRIGHVARHHVWPTNRAVSSFDGGVAPRIVETLGKYRK
ncbi:MAG: UDP-N-acetylglucosamine 2-epimerase (non-hydrolyzing) [Acidobacteria bacterium]|nr:MAG: UDP-N-acetylglucosamine 2-epimerase (non-hydrolyzing) [Acidobacteriota bacterium]